MGQPVYSDKCSLLWKWVNLCTPTSAAYCGSGQPVHSNKCSLLWKWVNLSYSTRASRCGSGSTCPLRRTPTSTRTAGCGSRSTCPLRHVRLAVEVGQPVHFDTCGSLWKWVNLSIQTRTARCGSGQPVHSNTYSSL